MEQPKAVSHLYDDFSGNALDSHRWVVGQMVAEGQVIWTWRDENLKLEAGQGKVILDIPEFSLKHDSVPMFDNPKALFCSTKTWSHHHEPIAFRTTLGGEFSGDPDDYRDGFASFNVLDFTTGTVLDIVLNGHKVWAIYELLAIPGVERPVEPFTQVVDLGMVSAPLKMHDVEVRYDPRSRRAQWWVDHELRLEREVVTDPQSFLVAFGIITLHPLSEQGSTSIRGQGGKAVFGPFHVCGKV